MKAFKITLAITAALMITSLAIANFIQPASEAQYAKIQSSLPDRHKIKRAVTVQSDKWNAYYVGAEFNTKAGMKWGIWFLVGSKERPGLIFSIDRIAKDYSRMGFAFPTKFKASDSDKEALMIEDYFEN